MLESLKDYKFEVDGEEPIYIDVPESVLIETINKQKDGELLHRIKMDFAKMVSNVCDLLNEYESYLPEKYYKSTAVANIDTALSDIEDEDEYQIITAAIH